MLNDRQKDQLQRMQATVNLAKPPALENTVAAFDITLPRVTSESGSIIGSRRRRHRNAMAYTIALNMDADEVCNF